jgi:hypothetical protein
MKGAQKWRTKGLGFYARVKLAEKNKLARSSIFNLGPAQGPLVVYRIHNDGPFSVLVGITDPVLGNLGVSGLNPQAGVVTVAIEPGCDCDITGSGIESGSEIIVTLLFTSRGSPQNASGTYQLMCCQPFAQQATTGVASSDQR